MRTESTLSFGAFADIVPPAVDGGVAVAVELVSSVPVTSTLCPTCGVSFESSASSRYCDIALAEPAVPEVDGGVLLEPIVAFARMNFVSLARPAVPVVPVVLEASAARCKQPVTVIGVFDALDGGCEVGGG
jgi:hypothetical protein